LVLDGVHGTVGSPVDSTSIALLENFLVTLSEAIVTKETLLLTISPSGEEVVANGRGSVRGAVDLNDFLVALFEEIHSEVELLDGTVAEALASDVLHE